MQSEARKNDGVEVRKGTACSVKTDGAERATAIDQAAINAHRVALKKECKRRRT